MTTDLEKCKTCKTRLGMRLKDLIQSSKNRYVCDAPK